MRLWQRRAWLVTRWFDWAWWRYLTRDSRGWRNFWCRVGEHRPGVWWFNAGGTEPDMRCRGCDEDLG